MNEPRTEILTAVEKKVAQDKMKRFITNANNIILKYFDMMSDVVKVNDDISMKSYRTTIEHPEVNINANDELVFVIDTDTLNVTFMTDEFETLMVFSFSKSTPEVCINDEIETHENLLLFLSELTKKIFTTDNGGYK